jgi:peroxiredoxin
VARQERRLLAVGAKAPGFRLPRLDGGDVTLVEILAGGPALLAFFKVSCPVCQLTFPFLERVHQTGALPVYGISQNDAKDTREFAKRFRTTFPMLLDSENSGFPVSNAYGISSVPTMFLVERDIERDGSIRQAMLGWRREEMMALGAVGPDDKVPQWKAG